MYELDDTKSTPAAPEVAPPRLGKPVELSRIVLRLRAARWLLIGAGLGGAAVGVTSAKLVAPVEYESHATLMWEPDEAEQADRPRAQKTLVDSIELPTTLAAIREKADLPMTVEQVGKRIEVTSTPQSNVLVLAAKSDEPETARRLAAVTVETMLEQRTRLYRARALDEEARLLADLERARATVKAGRADLVAFRREHGLVDVSIETQAAISDVAKLHSEANTARADADAEAARADTLRSRAKAGDERTVLAERIVRPAAVKLAELRADHASLEAQLSTEHPKAQAMDSAEQALEHSAKTEGRGATAEQTVGRNPLWDAVQQGLVKAEADENALRKRHDAYAGLAAQAEKRLAELGEVEGRASSLLAAVTAAETRQRELELAHAKVKDAVESPKSGLRVLVPADLPGTPSRSLRKPLAIAIPVLSVLLALVAVLVRALWGLRVHTANEVAYFSGMPVLATSSWPLDREQLDDLVAELTDQWGDRGAAAAVLALSADEVPLAGRLARRLARSVSARDSHASLEETVATSKRPLDGNHPEVRRIARKSARVLVVVRSGVHSAIRIAALKSTLGRDVPVGVVLVGLPSELAALPDRVGAPGALWRADCSA